MAYKIIDNAHKIVYTMYMDSIDKEILDITQEECAEVIVAISKINRFGLDNFKPNKPLTNRQHLEEELGDLMAMINIVCDKGIASYANVELAAHAKIKKLQQWSNIFKETTDETQSK